MDTQATLTTRPRATARFKSRSEIFAIFAACSLPIFVWAIPLTLAYISGWLLRLTLVETLSVIAYILAFVLLESLLVFAVVMVLILILPRRLFGDFLVPFAALFSLLSTGFIIFLNMTQERALNAGNVWGALAALAVYVVLVALAYIALRRSPRLARIINSLIDRLVPLTMIYATLGVLGLAGVIIRFFLA